MPFVSQVKLSQFIVERHLLLKRPTKRLEKKIIGFITSIQLSLKDVAVIYTSFIEIVCLCFNELD